MNEQNEQARQTVASPIRKRSVKVAGHKTSISLEEPFWQALQKIATERGITTAALINSIASKRVEGNLSSALRVAVLEHFRAARSQASERGLRQQRPRVRSEDDKG